MSSRNWDPAVARSLHERTKHTYESVRRAGPLDWANRPWPFKEYEGLEAVPLPDPAPPADVPALAALAGSPGPPRPLAPADRGSPRAMPRGLPPNHGSLRHVPGAAPELARLLRYGAGVNKVRRYGPDVYAFRTYSSAGALYPVEVYVADADGLWHFHPRELALRRLRREDVRATLTNAADAPPAEAVLALSGILWRTAWKYRERGYRHLYWDAGTMLANLLALAASGGHAPQLFTGFVDAQVNRVLGVDGQREAALALLALGRGGRAPAASDPPPLELTVAPLSRTEVAHEAVWDLHAASALDSPDAVRRYRAGAPPPPAAPAPDDGGGALEAAIERRVSARDFTREPVPLETLARLLAVAAAPIPADVAASNELFLIAHAVAGLAPGTYHYRPPDRFELLREGDFRAQAGYLVLEQELGERAAAVVFLAADLDRVLSTLGNRGYRSAQLEAGIRAGRVQIGAYALGLAAVASTFYDDDVAEFLTQGRSPLLCVALGNRPRRR